MNSLWKDQLDVVLKRSSDVEVMEIAEYVLNRCYEHVTDPEFISNLHDSRVSVHFSIAYYDPTPYEAEYK